MLSIYSGLAVWNLLALVGWAAFGVAHLGFGVGEPRVFQLAGLFAAVFCCLVQSLLVIHFIGTMKWIQQSGPTAGIEDTKPLRTAWIRGRMFPVLTWAMLAAVAAAILAGGAVSGGVPSWLPVALALAAAVLSGWGMVLARREIVATRARMHDVALRMEERIAAGLVRDEDAGQLLPESSQAGGKTFVFLAVNVWVLWAYLRFVLRNPDHPTWPYAVASIVLAGIGLSLLRRPPEA